MNPNPKTVRRKHKNCATENLLRVAWFWALLIPLTLTSFVSFAQVLTKVEPMGNWVEYIKLHHNGKPLQVHLRTGYESAVIFPEPIVLYSVNKIAFSGQSTPELPNCKIEIDTEVMGFSPLQRFKKQTVSVRGTRTGTIYELEVRSSPTGRRQPIQLLR